MKRKRLEHFLFLYPEQPDEFIIIKTQPHDIYRAKNRESYGSILRITSSVLLPVFLFQIHIPSTNETFVQKSINIPEDGIHKKNNNEDWYLFEEVYPHSADDLKKMGLSILQSSSRETSLSIKNILDPKDGLDRLLENIASFPNAKRLEKLLHIIRAATEDEERKIYQSLRINDPSFYFYIREKIFSQDLLGFMEKREIFNILSRLPDEDLVEIFDHPEAIQKIYKKCVSKNRLENIRHIHQNRAQPIKKEKPLWDHIMEYYQKNYSSLRLTLLDPQRGVIDKTNAEDEFYYKCRGQRNIIRRIPYMQSESAICIIGFCSNYLIFQLKQKASFLQFYYEVHRYEFNEKIFTQVFPGTYAFAIEKIPRIILAAGFDVEKKFWESKAFYMNER